MFAKDVSYKKSGRFYTIKELRDLYPILTELHSKNQELKSTVDNNAGDPAYKKSVIIANLCQQLNIIIEQFNELQVTGDRHTDMHNVLVLLLHLRNTILVCLDKYRSVLNVPRPTLTHTASENMSSVTVASSIGLGFFSSSLLLALAPIGGALVAEGTSKLMGWDKSPTASVSILKRFLDKLNSIDLSLRFVKDEFLDDFTTNRALVLFCPLSLKRMTTPVLCTLDNRMYQKEAIVEHLTQYGTSPFNNKPLPSGKSIESVLIENETLRLAMDELESCYAGLNPQPSAPPFEYDENFNQQMESPGAGPS